MIKSGKYLLGDIFKITSGGTPNRSNKEYFTNGTIPWFKTGDLKVKDLYKAEEYITIEALENCSAKIFPKDTLLVALYGATIGACSIQRIEAATNQACAAILPNENVSPDFLYFYFLSIKPKLVEQGVGGGQPNISGAILKNTEIDLPSLPEQQKIAAILSEVDAAREKRKQANQLTEQFLQSTFLSLFGDPVKNEKGWEVVQFSDAVNIEKNTIQSEDIQPEELYIGLEHIEKDTGELIGFQKMFDAELKSTKFKFTEENILYGKLRPYLNKVCFPSFSGVCSTDILPIKAKGKIASKCFIGYLMKQPFFIDKATSMSNGANLPRISPKVLETFEIILPPLSLQQKFAGIVQQTEQLRSKQRQSEQELEQLFQSLLQRYFG